MPSLYNDYSRLTLVFFLLLRNETSGILKSFITGIENLVDHKVKVIRCDNRTEFKNREMNQFYEMKGILRQFCVARTPQQNGVAKRRNRTLIEAAKTMLADSKLPTTFGPEVVKYYLLCGKIRVYTSNVYESEQYKIKYNSSHDDRSKPSSDNRKKVDKDPRKDSEYDKDDGANPTTRIHKDHPLNQVIGDLQSATQTRKMSKNLEEHGIQAGIDDYSKELLQFKLQEVWFLVDLPNGKRAIGSKWVFRNKKDERGIVIRNKARLVVQGYTQEEGIDYDEVFAPIARIEAIMLLAYASFKVMILWCDQMDVKSTLSMGR
ncbi:putative ribonuclease H-like domain-containing protein [Tanacetum coccineum]